MRSGDILPVAGLEERETEEVVKTKARARLLRQYSGGSTRDRASLCPCQDSLALVGSSWGMSVIQAGKIARFNSLDACWRGVAHCRIQLSVTVTISASLLFTPTSVCNPLQTMRHLRHFAGIQITHLPLPFTFLPSSSLLPCHCLEPLSSLSPIQFILFIIVSPSFVSSCSFVLFVIYLSSSSPPSILVRPTLC